MDTPGGNCGEKGRRSRTSNLESPKPKKGKGKRKTDSSESTMFGDGALCEYDE